jgi:hypothetical protein
VRKPNSLLIVRRDEFDAALVGEVRRRGIEVREGVSLEGLEMPAEAGGRWCSIRRRAR